MNSNQGKDQKQSTPDNSVNDPMKDLTATNGQGSGSQQSGRQQGSQQSGQQQQGQQGSQQSGQQQGQQGRQQQGNQQQGRQGGNQQQGGGQHASGGTPALDDLDGQSQGESAQQASEAFRQQGDRGGNR